MSHNLWWGAGAGAGTPLGEQAGRQAGRGWCVQQGGASAEGGAVPCKRTVCAAGEQQGGAGADGSGLHAPSTGMLCCMAPCSGPHLKQVAAGHDLPGRDFGLEKVEGDGIVQVLVPAGEGEGGLAWREEQLDRSQVSDEAEVSRWRDSDVGGGPWNPAVPASAPPAALRRSTQPAALRAPAHHTPGIQPLLPGARHVERGKDRLVGRVLARIPAVRVGSGCVASMRRAGQAGISVY